MTTSIARRRSGTVTRRLLVRLSVLVATLLLAGCVSTASGMPAQLQRTLEQARSAATTAQASFDQFQAGRTFWTTADTTCTDMLTIAQNARNDAAALGTDTRSQSASRITALKLVDQTVTLIASVQDYLHHAGELSPRELHAGLRSNRADLTALIDSLGSRP